MHSRIDAQRQADDDRQQNAEYGDVEGIREAFDQLVLDVRAGDQARAEVKVKEDVLDVLRQSNDKGPVEAHRLTLELDLLRRVRARAEGELSGVSGNEIHEREHDDADRQKQRDHDDEPLDDIFCHSPSPFRGIVPLFS